ncbi:plexin-C1-like [Poecilia latipinna]|uniref:plexin-C1-like n=1 Tax=Poecilia latipinna TaxID=48699 RepID=UPI00072EDF85|nr:PREDICTED: plexin-C1-like [Poecilia latipinna]
MILLLCLLCFICGEPAWSLEVQEFTVKEDIQQVAVANNNLYVATVKTLYWWVNLNPDKRPETAQIPSYVIIHMFLFVKNRLISCGVNEKRKCYCESRDLKNINKVVYSENFLVGPQRSSSGSVSFLVDVKKNSGQTETYILTAIKNHRDKTEEDKCSADLKTINLHNTDQKQNGGLFSRLDQSGSSPPGIQSEADVDFVDGFQINSTVYLFSNVASGGETNKVRLIWLQAETNKTQTLESLRGATLSSSGGEGSRLLASSVVPGGQQVLWSGVFSVDKGRENTELLLFDISPDLSREANTDPDFYTSVDKPNNPSKPKSLEPKAVLFKKKYMNSVLVVKQDNWMVFFIGTSNGQLIKLPVDKNNRPACPKELHRASGKENVFSKILLNPLDHKHIYLQSKKQIKRVTVSNCDEYKRAEDCRTDPFCVWCASKESCTFSKNGCKDDWLSIPDEYQQEVISHRVVKDSTGEVKIVVKVHLTVAQKIQSNFTSQISTTSDRPCRQNEPQPQYPECTCILSDDLNAKELDVTVKITFSKTTLTKQLKLFDCSKSSLLCQQCIRAGCGWKENRCTWDSEGERNESVCQKSSSKANLVPGNISVSPSRVSYYGRNNAILRGHNLTDVIAVKIQAEMDCLPQESPVWNKTGESLTFHIPRRTNEAEAKVCVVLSDGSCHGEAKIAYQSAPSCNSTSPTTIWRSGKRKITLFGSDLESVEMVIHRYNQSWFYYLEGAVPENKNSENFTYETPEGQTAWLYCSIYLKVANETLYCLYIQYHPDPQFTTFISKRTGNNVQVMIQCLDWGLEMTTEELSVWGVKDGWQYPCIMKGKNKTHTGANYFICEIQNTTHVKFSQLTIKYGRMTVQVGSPPLTDQYLLMLRLLLVPCGTAVLVIICHCLAMKNKP